MQFDDFLKVLDLLQNPDKFAAQINDLTQRHTQIQDALIQVHARVDVAITQEQADQHLKDSANVLTQAKVDAETALSSAKRFYDKELSALEVRERAAEQAIQALASSKASWAQKAADHKVTQDAIDAAKAQLEKDQIELRSKQADVDSRLDKLRQVMGS